MDAAGFCDGGRLGPKSSSFCQLLSILLKAFSLALLHTFPPVAFHAFPGKLIIFLGSHNTASVVFDKTVQPVTVNKTVIITANKIPFFEVMFVLPSCMATFR